MSKRFVLIAVLLLVCAPAFAFRGRPVTDLTYDQVLPRVMDVSAATDGRDFLAVMVDGHYTDPRVYAQLVGANGPKAPAFYVARARDAAVVWSGSSYLLALSGEAGLQVARVSASGALIDPPRTIAPPGHNGLRVASNGDRTLIATVPHGRRALTGWLLESGRVVRGAFTVVNGDNGYDLVGTESGFALAELELKLTLRRLDRDGNVIGAPVVVDGPFVGNGGPSYFVGTLLPSGDELTVVYTYTTAVYERLTRVMFARIGARGEVLQAPRLVRSVPYPQAFAVGRAVRDGRGFAVATAASRDVIFHRTDSDPALMRLDADGTLRELTPLANEPLEERPTAFVSNDAGEHFIAWSRGHFDYPHPSLAAVIRGSDVTRFALGQASGEQYRPAMASRRGEYLVAWRERVGNDWQLRASRIDRNGCYRDGVGIIVADTFADSLDVATDGTNWLVVWASYGTAYARQITAAGELAAPINLGDARASAVEWGSDRYLVALETDDAIITKTISADGVASPLLATIASNSGKGTEEDPQILFGSVALAFDGREFQLALARLTTGFYRTVSPQQFYFRATGFQRIDAHGLPAGKLTILPLDTYHAPRIATNGRQTFIVANGALLLSNESVRAVRVPYANARNWTGVLDVTSDGRDFIVVQETPDAKLMIMRVSAEGGLSDVRLIDGHHEYPALAGDSGSAPMLATTERDASFEEVPRTAIAFVSELGSREPQQPVVTSSRIGEDDVEVAWLPLSDAFVRGVVIEVELEPEVWRVVGVAPACAGSAHLPLHGLEPSRVRVRTW